MASFSSALYDLHWLTSLFSHFYSASFSITRHNFALPLVSLQSLVLVLLAAKLVLAATKLANRPAYFNAQKGTILYQLGFLPSCVRVHFGVTLERGRRSGTLSRTLATSTKSGARNIVRHSTRMAAIFRTPRRGQEGFGLLLVEAWPTRFLERRHWLRPSTAVASSVTLSPLVVGALLLLLPLSSPLENSHQNMFLRMMIGWRSMRSSFTSLTTCTWATRSTLRNKIVINWWPSS